MHYPFQRARSTLLLALVCLASAAIKLDAQTGQGATVAVALMGTATGGISGAASFTLTVDIENPDGSYTSKVATGNRTSGGSGFVSNQVAVSLEVGRIYSLRVHLVQAAFVTAVLAPPPGYDIELDGTRIRRVTVSNEFEPGSPNPHVNDEDHALRLIPAGSFQDLAPAGTSTSLGSDGIHWKLYLGALQNGTSAGQIELVYAGRKGGSTPWSDLFFITNLSYRAPSSEVLDPPLGATRRQIFAQEACVDIDYGSFAPGAGFRIRFFHRDQTVVGASTANPRFTFLGDPYITYLVEQASATKIQITREERDVTSPSSINLTPVVTMTTSLSRTGTWDPGYNWTLEDWHSGSGAARVEKHAWTASTGSLDHSDAGSVASSATAAAVSSVTGSFLSYAWGESIRTQKIGTTPTTGADTSVTTTFTHYDDTAQIGSYSFLKLATSTDGAWQAFEYSSAVLSADPAADTSQRIGVPLRLHRPFGNTAAPGETDTLTATTAGEVTEFTYASDPFAVTYGIGYRPTQIVNTIDGVAAGKTTIGYADSDFSPDGVVNQHLVTATRSDFNDASHSLASITKYFREDTGDYFFQRQLHSVQRPDGTKDSFAYQHGTFSGTTFTPSASGAASRVAVIHGTTATGTGIAAYASFVLPATSTVTYNLDSVNLVTAKSTLETIIRDANAHVVRTETWVWDGTDWQPVGAQTFTYDYCNRLTDRQDGYTGALFHINYVGSRRNNDTDEAGVSHTYSYDVAGRIATVVKGNGPTTTYSYDAEGRVLSESVQGDGETIVNARTFDDAGRLKTETPAGRGTTTISYAYDVGNRTRTATLPSAATGGGGTRIETYLADGRLDSLVGTAVVGEFYSYDASTGQLRTQVDFGSRGSSRSKKVFTDWLGRTVSTQRPGFSGSSQGAFTEQYSYDLTKGQLLSIASTTLVGTTVTNLYAPTLFVYDALGRVIRSGLNIAGGGTLTPASADRITDHDAFFESTTSDGWWLREETKTYPSATALTTSIVRQRLTSFASNRLQETKSTDVDGNVTIRTVDVDRGTQTLTITTTPPGVANPLIETISNGLPTSVRDVDLLSYSTGYDGLERPHTRVDARNSNTTTTNYFSGTTLVSSVVDAVTTAASKTLLSCDYDALGRRLWCQNANGNTTRYAYNTRSQLTNQWGDAASPVAFGYDSTYGDRTTMSTYRSGGDATAWNQSTWPSAPGTADLTRWDYDEASGLLSKKYDAANLTTAGQPITAAKKVEYDYNARGQTASRKWARMLTSASTTPVTTSYAYDANTGELTDITYNDSGEPIPTHAVHYTYTRLGQLDSVSDAAGFRDFIYDPTHLNRLATEALDVNFYAGRLITRLYDPASGGSFGGYTTGVVAGAPAGFDLGVPTNTQRDLHQKFTYSNAGRFVGVSTSAANGGARDFIYNYVASSALVSGYSAAGIGASFNVSREFDTSRDLVTHLEAKWGTTSVTRFDLAYNPQRQTASAQQSGTAFADYTTGTSSNSVYNYYAYNSRGEMKTAVMARGMPPANLASPASGDQLPGRRFEYRYDNFGNRLTTGPVDPDPAGNASLQAALDDHYAPNSLNQYATKENRLVHVLGSATAGASVSATGAPISMLDRNFAADVVPANTSGPTQGMVMIGAGVSGSGSAYVAKTISRTYFAPQQTQTLAYDADGNLIDDGVWHYTYDAENRLVRIGSVLLANVGFTRLELDFKYDHLGRRIEKQVFNLDGGTTPTFDHRYIYDGWALVAETSAAGAMVRSYTWGLDVQDALNATGGVGALVQLVNHNANGTTTAYFPSIDGNGNISSLTREDGTLAAVYEYSPFGDLLRAETLDPAVGDQPFRFASKYTDSESGLVYFGTRYYSANLGRFINRDSIGEAGGLNLYGYASNDAINGFDVLGMCYGDGGDGDGYGWGWGLVFGGGFGGGSGGGTIVTQGPRAATSVNPLPGQGAVWGQLGGLPTGAYERRSIYVTDGIWASSSGQVYSTADEAMGNTPRDSTGTLVLRTAGIVGGDLVRTAKGQIVRIYDRILRPVELLVDEVDKLVAAGTETLIPGMGPHVRGLVTAGSMVVGPGEIKGVLKAGSKILSAGEKVAAAEEIVAGRGAVEAEKAAVLAGNTSKAAAREPTIGEIIGNADPDSMIHLTPLSEARLADGVIGGSFVRYGDVSNMTVAEYQAVVVGNNAPASLGEPVRGFVVANPGTAPFNPSIEKGLAGVLEHTSGKAFIPDRYVKLPSRP